MTAGPTDDGPADLADLADLADPAGLRERADPVDPAELGRAVRADLGPGGAGAGAVDAPTVGRLLEGAEVVIGIGTDLVDLDRFRTVLDRTPGVVDRVFTDGERRYADQRHDPIERYGARFAAKEATMKALGVGLGEVVMRDIEVVRSESGEPTLRLHGTARDAAEARGARRLLITMTHTDHLAQAVVVALGDRSATTTDEP